MSKNESVADVDVGAGYENLDEVIAKSKPQYKNQPPPLPRDPASISDSGKASESDRFYAANRENKSDSSKGPVSHMRMPAKAKSRSEKVASHDKKTLSSRSKDTTSRGSKATSKGSLATSKGSKVTSQGIKSKYKIVADGEKEVNPQLYESMVRFVCDYYMDTKKAFLVTGIITIFLVVLPLIADLVWLKYVHTLQLSKNTASQPISCIAEKDYPFVMLYPYSQIPASVFGLVVGVLFMLISIYFPRRRPLLMTSIIVAFIELIFFLIAFSLTIGYFSVIGKWECLEPNIWVQPSINLTLEIFCIIWCIFCIILGIKVWKLKKKGLEELARSKEGMP